MDTLSVKTWLCRTHLSDELSYGHMRRFPDIALRVNRPVSTIYVCQFLSRLDALEKATMEGHLEWPN